ncbi:hypothetical protein [Nitrosomonas oligotropha]|jgi:hypothetical protein|uniref:hypothetical protein n=1 Tax=Nitrosomonas oligotropha TaxID=42354 RepID=UPI00136B4C0A|nr:hypothetical protein [Nitrosomonas oligotropha]
MKLRFIMSLVTLSVLLGSSVQLIAAPSPPTLTHSISGFTVTASWTSVPGATEYKLSYAPIPYTGPESIASLNVGGVTSFTANLWEGAAFYIAVQAGDGNEFSEYSNIDNFSLASSSENLSGYWHITETFGPNNCAYPVGVQYDYYVTFTQSGNSITADRSSDLLSGNLVGNTATLTRSYEDNEGGEYYAEIDTMKLTILPDNSISGSYSVISGNKPGDYSGCSTNNSFIGTKTDSIPKDD